MQGRDLQCWLLPACRTSAAPVSGAPPKLMSREESGIVCGNNGQIIDTFFSSFWMRKVKEKIFGAPVMS